MPASCSSVYSCSSHAHEFEFCRRSVQLRVFDDVHTDVKPPAARCVLLILECWSRYVCSMLVKKLRIYERK